MHPQTILHLYDQQMRQNASPAGGAIHQQPGLTFFTLPPPSPFAGWVLYTRLDPAAADQAIQATLDFFQPLGGEFEWKVYDHDTPPDLKDRLLARGFVPEETEAVLALDLETVPPAFWDRPAAEVRRLTDPAQLSAVTHIEAEVWGESFDDLEATLSAEMQSAPDRLSVYVAYAGGQPASSAWTRFYPPASSPSFTAAPPSPATAARASTPPWSKPAPAKPASAASASSWWTPAP